MEPATTITQAFVRTAAEQRDEVAYRTRGDEISITWGEARERVAELASRLAGLGLRRGDTVALMLANRPEFHICDLAVLMTGATPFSVYQTSPPNQIQFIVGDAGSRVMITEQSFLGRILEARRELPNLETVIVIDGEAPEGVLALADLPAADTGFDLDAAAASVDAEDLLTLIYTSGTTGPPKGVEITHRAFFAYADGLLDNVPNLKRGSHVISWLPNAHVAERNAHHYLPIVCQMHVTCCADGRQVLDYVAEVRPSWFFAVPRIWEKLQTRAEALLAEAPMYAPASLGDAIEKVRLEQRGEPVPPQLASRVAESDERTFFSIRRALGLDRANCHIGAAPAAPELIEFFLGLGVNLSEIYGMSETTGAGTMNPPDAPRIGSSGKAVRNVELKLAEDGEILVRGPIMMRRYRNLPQATEAAYEDGWFLTGDIGEIDEDGYVRIVDRKKELIINAAGKNMSPANIEAALKSASPLIGQACVIGDGRPYNSALVVLDVEYALVWAAELGLADRTLPQLAAHERVRAAVQDGVDRANSTLSRVEQIKRFTIMPTDWPAAGDELTPTMKLKRKPIALKYAATIEAIYDGEQ
ncbi:MAG: long-chain acyl-CoA synthetase [Solirubrobacteraceae bacterium]|jgi:long-subunit acyl-CoA synthetase (AMP-forming)|nr:long-chain acyl-CoA synthetase [Solirubrobacteraceae bacterium]